MKHCKNCGEELKSHWKECPKCETPVIVEAKCLSCGYGLKPTWKRCPECGTRVKQNLFRFKELRKTHFP